MTKQRQAILDVLQKMPAALSAAEVHAELPDIDLATIYRNLEHFTEAKLIKKLQLGSAEARFEYQAKPHHHAVCSECERVIHFTAPNQKLKTLLRVSDFVVDEIEVTVRGVCTRGHYRR